MHVHQFHTYDVLIECCSVRSKDIVQTQVSKRLLNKVGLSKANTIYLKENVYVSRARTKYISTVIRYVKSNQLMKSISRSSYPD